MDINIIKLDDGFEYMILLAITKEDNNYFLLAKKDYPEEVILRKVIKNIDGKEYLGLLDDDSEFDEVMTIVNEKLNKKEEEK